MGRKTKKKKEFGKCYISQSDRLQFLYMGTALPDHSYEYTGAQPVWSTTSLKIGMFVTPALRKMPYIPGYIRTSKGLNRFNDKECVHVKLEGLLRATIPLWDGKLPDERLSSNSPTVYPAGRSPDRVNWSVAKNYFGTENSDGTCGTTNGRLFGCDTIIIDPYHSQTYHFNGYTSPNTSGDRAIWSGGSLNVRLISLDDSDSEQRIVLEVTTSLLESYVGSRISSAMGSEWIDPPYSRTHDVTHDKWRFTCRYTIMLKKTYSSGVPKFSAVTVVPSITSWHGETRNYKHEWQSDNPASRGSLLKALSKDVMSSSPIAFQDASAFAEAYFRRAEAQAWKDVANCYAHDDGQWAAHAVVAAVDNTHVVDCNGIDFLRDLPGLAPSVADALKCIRDIRKGKLSSMADLYLIFKYVWSTTLSDAKAYREARESRISKYLGALIAQGRSPSSTYTFRGDTVDCDSWVKVYYNYCDQGKLSNVYKAMWQWGLFPTAKNIWDLVPFSFVVDWFIQLDDLIASIDHQYGSHYIYNVESVIQTFKCVHSHAPVTFEAYDIRSDTRLATYVRQVKRELPPMPMWSPSPSGLSTHWWEGAALFVQRTKK